MLLINIIYIILIEFVNETIEERWEYNAKKKLLIEKKERKSFI